MDLNEMAIEDFKRAENRLGSARSEYETGEYKNSYIIKQLEASIRELESIVALLSD